jgi:glycosyltransferase involved in cell wall biosynthesis
MNATKRTTVRMAISVKTAEGGRWIVPQILEARRRGIEVVAVIPAGRGRLATSLEELAENDAGFSVIRSAFDFSFRPSIGCLRGLLRLRKQIRSLDVDVILYHLYATALAIRIATLFLPIRRVHMVAGPLYLESRLIRVVETFLARLDTVIVCGSEYTRARYLDIHVSASRLRMVPYGVDLDRFRPPEDKPRSAPDGLRVIMVAYVYAPKSLAFAGRGIKGHADLLDAWRPFHDKHPHSTLTLVGSGFDEAGEAYRNRLLTALPAAPESLGLTWLTSVDDVRSLYEKADVSISPSLSENHGAALEASAMGLPCIVSDAGALPEAVDDASGWVHRAGDPASIETALELALAAKKAQRLVHMGGAARRLMEQEFDQARSATEVIDIVQSSRPSAERRS